MGMQSSVDDLLVWTKAVMREDMEAEQCPDQVYNHPSILRGATVARLPFFQTWSRDDVNSWAYCMGWTKTKMPTSRFGALSYNFAAQDHRFAQPEKYIIGGNDTTNRTILQCNGTVNGSNCGLYTFPETESAIMVCCNGLTNGDAADWAARILTQALFNLQPRIDFLELARIEADARNAHYQAMLTEWHSNYDPVPQSVADVLRFVGIYNGMATSLTITSRTKTYDADPASLSSPASDSDRSSLGLHVVFNDI
ncbi:uncharacterized protein LY89DRAFT_730071 [Mollisia scopiformis]|uniref:Beta-lactamase-related domain-containing protein n=1 Tax=Mollisia scopiformis TaxID=149040 RepID=A0A194XM12_MOLSC|nr:uncharacterized protein LY89DRAFT_730071 [Mollisia scopiformis]KUJ21285.1 hypothetical protein LY89DRAFT_730071 [Mollisia scopiformis]